MNTLQLRQSIAGAIRELEANGEPIILDNRNRPVAVIISLKDFQERFAEKAASEAIAKVVAEMDLLARPAADKKSGVEILRILRDS